jgi:Ser/Thr protein kinase RdoA (MazF antagonist)
VRGDLHDYVLQRVNQAVFTDPEGLTANMLAVHRHVGADLTPIPVAAPDGRFLLAHGDHLWRAAECVPDAATCGDIDPDLARQAGVFLGKFHGALAGFDPDQLVVTLPGFHDVRARVAALRGAVAADRCGRVAAAGPEIEATLDAAPLADVAEALTQRVPVRAAHFDAKLDNVLFRERRAVCLVDLDTLMPGAWLWDIGDLVRSATTRAAEDAVDPRTAVVDPTLYDEVLAGYRAALPPDLLTPAEEEAIEVAGAIATYEVAVRFLTDWLGGDTYFRTSRPDHNLHRARAQLMLCSSMPSPWSAPGS